MQFGFSQATRRRARRQCQGERRSGEALDDPVVEKRPADIGGRGPDQLAHLDLVAAGEDLQADQVPDDEERPPRRARQRTPRRAPAPRSSSSARGVSAHSKSAEHLVHLGKLRPGARAASLTRSPALVRTRTKACGQRVAVEVGEEFGEVRVVALSSSSASGARDEAQRADVRVAP